jgi:hypothetical protein
MTLEVEMMEVEDPGSNDGMSERCWCCREKRSSLNIATMITWKGLYCRQLREQTKHNFTHQQPFQIHCPPKMLLPCRGACDLSGGMCHTFPSIYSRDPVFLLHQVLPF